MLTVLCLPMWGNIRLLGGFVCKSIFNRLAINHFEFRNLWGLEIIVSSDFLTGFKNSWLFLQKLNRWRSVKKIVDKGKYFYFLLFLVPRYYLLPFGTFFWVVYRRSNFWMVDNFTFMWHKTIYRHVEFTIIQAAICNILSPESKYEFFRRTTSILVECGAQFAFHPHSTHTSHHSFSKTISISLWNSPPPRARVNSELKLQSESQNPQ